MGMLDGLLRIKQFREDKAEREVARARQALLVAEKATEKARKALRDYLHECDERERAMYRELMSRIVHKSDFDDVELSIKLMREKVPEFEQAVDAAQQAEQRARDAVDAARSRHQNAIRMREKFTELVSEEKLVLIQEALLNEEREMEEVPHRSLAQRAGDQDAPEDREQREQSEQGEQQEEAA